MGWLEPDELAEIRAAVEESFDTVATLTRSFPVSNEYGREVADPEVHLAPVTIPGRLREESQPRVITEGDQTRTVRFWKFRCRVGTAIPLGAFLTIGGAEYRVEESDAGRSEATVQVYTLMKTV